MRILAVPSLQQRFQNISSEEYTRLYPFGTRHQIMFVTWRGVFCGREGQIGWGTERKWVPTFMQRL